MSTVIAIDIDPLKIELARNNARVYGVEERIEFIVGDFTKLANHLRADVVFLSPPWGGPEYVSVDAYSLDNILPPLGGQELFRLASNVAPDIAYFLPRNVNSTEVRQKYLSNANTRKIKFFHISKLNPLHRLTTNSLFLFFERPKQAVFAVLILRDVCTG